MVAAQRSRGASAAGSESSGHLRPSGDRGWLHGQLQGGQNGGAHNKNSRRARAALPGEEGDAALEVRARPRHEIGSGSGRVSLITRSRCCKAGGHGDNSVGVPIRGRSWATQRFGKCGRAAAEALITAATISGAVTWIEMNETGCGGTLRDEVIQEQSKDGSVFQLNPSEHSSVVKSQYQRSTRRCTNHFGLGSAPLKIERPLRSTIWLSRFSHDATNNFLFPRTRQSIGRSQRSTTHAAKRATPGRNRTSWSTSRTENGKYSEESCDLLSPRGRKLEPTLVYRCSSHQDFWMCQTMIGAVPE